MTTSKPQAQLQLARTYSIAGEHGIKSLPFDITARIVSYLPADDVVFLALTSHHYHDLITKQVFKNKPLKDICVAPQRCAVCQENLNASHRDRHTPYFNLMIRMEPFMGQRKFCHQCERYVKDKNHFKAGRRKSCPWLKTVQLSKWDLRFQQAIDRFSGWGSKEGAGYVGVSNGRYAAMI